MFAPEYFSDSYFSDSYFNDPEAIVVAPVTVSTPLGVRCFTTIKERLVYIRPDGVRYGLHSPPSRVVTAEEGFGAPPLQYVTDEAPFQHGDTVRSFRLQPRPIQFVVMQQFTSRAAYRAGRALLLDTMRPNRITDFTNPGKLLYYLADGTKRQLDVVPETGPGFTPDQGGWRAWSFTEALRFVAHDPVWYDPQQYSVTFAEVDPAWTFPVTFPITFGPFGAMTVVTYTGTWEEYPTITITGPVTAARIDNLTANTKLEMNCVIPAGNTVTINLHGRKTITRDDGVNLMGYLSGDSDLTTFALLPDPQVPGGNNQLRVTGSGTTGASSVVLTYYNRYYGI